ncbi:LysR family transcriptional regulator [Neoroseomonas oryzicola]|uniref:LysR family transcriptional regulator n=1 Tax=Neoroseomonas oryzicola TaxID=535904 RepID=A0A9X9WE70_9PROT|nr:LysR family transcriptional regulator [Neoroseomonas oryzicola]MBR0658630.1 LysR family transcriptional regulator [Neoroseomonas oryzicola]NKE17934.1 LysR family transcriptional regulator [Neoroseomonas oryzicola]
MPELNYHHLRYFHAVAHEGNLTRAAARLNLAPSALSAQIRTLEDRLGQPLFERSGRRLVLTEAGRIALAHADAIFAAGEELVATLQETRRAQRILRVGALATLSRNFQLAFLRPVLGRPDVEVILRSGGMAELLRALADLELDAVLTSEAPAAGGFVAHRLAEEPVSLVGRPALLAGRASLAERLAAAPLILPTPDSGLRAGFEALRERLGVTLLIAAEVDDMAMMRLLAREGVGLAVLPPIVVRDELASGELQEAERLPGLVQPFHAVTVARRFPNPLLRELLRGEVMVR